MIQPTMLMYLNTSAIIIIEVYFYFYFLVLLYVTVMAFPYSSKLTGGGG